jgi:hypothetical protein
MPSRLNSGRFASASSGQTFQATPKMRMKVNTAEPAYIIIDMSFLFAMGHNIIACVLGKLVFS